MTGLAETVAPAGVWGVIGAGCVIAMIACAAWALTVATAGLIQGRRGPAPFATVAEPEIGGDIAQILCGPCHGWADPDGCTCLSPCGASGCEAAEPGEWTEQFLAIIDHEAGRG